MLKTAVTGVLVLILAAVVWSAPTGKTTSQQGQLKQLITELQNTPEDNALREKIIALVQKMRPRPALPQEARRPFMKGTTFMKDATSASDYELAITSYKEALLIAPWWPEAYYNLALTQESAGKFDEAIQSLKFYLLTKPKDAQHAEDRMYALEAKKEKAAKEEARAAQATRDEEARAAQAARDKEKQAEAIRSLEGARFIFHRSSNMYKVDYIVEVRDGQAVWGRNSLWNAPGMANDLGYEEWGRGPIEYFGSVIPGWAICKFHLHIGGGDWYGTFSEDSRSLRMVRLIEGKDVGGEEVGQYDRQ